MNKTKTAVGLSLTVCLAMLVHACQPESIQDNRNTSTGGTTQSATKTGDANPGGNKTEVPPANTGTAPVPAAAANFTMTWDVPADTAIVSYKVFLVPSDGNARFPGKTDVPIQIKNYLLADLQKNGEKYSVVVSNDQIKAALGTIPAPVTKCFSIVAVNGVGNSSYSPVICP